ncbi:MAG TPA: T9SS type A sorting domain-containing protein [Ignavibacteria bacterium]
MKYLKILFLVIIVSFVTKKTSICQFNISDFKCEVFTTQGANTSISDPFGGLYKPNRTDRSGGGSAPSDAYFPVLVVFVQFPDEPTDPRSTWPTNSAPIYLDSIIATEKYDVGNWWQFYNPETEAISSMWAEMSRGIFHVINPVPYTYTHKAFSVVLPKTPVEYWLDNGRDIVSAQEQLNKDIWNSIRSQGLTDWRMYDRWKKVGSLFYYTDLGYGDGNVDFVYKIHKSGGIIVYNDTVRGYLISARAGFNQLNWNYLNPYEVDTVNHIYIDYGSSQNGSGITVCFRGQKSIYLSTVGHEHGHQLYNYNHTTYSRVSFGVGFDYFYSPFEMIYNEYMTPQNATYGQSHILNDYSSRDTSGGQILKVPIGTNEYFLLANRRKISKWDRLMVGDTAQLNAYDDYSEYGKGLYIYHIFGGLNLNTENPQDLESADGYWGWELGGYDYNGVPFDCFQSPQANWSWYKKTQPLYTNDPSTLGNTNMYGDLLSFHYASDGDKFNARNHWWGIGEKSTNACVIGTERTFTNDQDAYPGGFNMGNRWDAWKVDYNEMFSPYSSPSTMDKNNDSTGIYIYYYNQNGNTAGIKIYKEGEDGFTRDSILKITPPSRPMGIKIDVTECENERRYPVITWVHNTEPDMLQPGYPQPLYKRYKIFRAWDKINNIPGNFSEIADVLIHKDNEPSYTDYNTYGHCANGTGEVNYRLRYKVKAVDNTNLASVYSDFVSISTYYLNRGNNDSGNPKSDENLPKSFTLYQNYPNPFNPITKINYDLPKDSKVSLVIYDILGREIVRLVNGEFKPAGRYMIDFNGSNLSSGVYFYKIQAGDFVSVKRMVLIK